jgi:hypothetical protein
MFCVTPNKGDAQCEVAVQYRANLPKRFENEAQTLANLTGWGIDAIRKDMNQAGQSFKEPKKGSWWKRLWGNDSKKG